MTASAVVRFPDDCTSFRRKADVMSDQDKPITDGQQYGVGQAVPVSGIYNVVSRSGRYLKHQIACHVGQPFPPTSRRITRGRPYRYELEFEAAHLHRGEVAERRPDCTVHRPGDLVSVSGVYTVVDGHGVKLGHQHTLVERKRFPELSPEDPRARGYVLDYQARHRPHRGRRPAAA
jgi:hypothetical protein